MAQDKDTKPPATRPDMVIAKSGVVLDGPRELRVEHSAKVVPSRGAALYPGGPTTVYFATCEGCGWNGPVRTDSYEASGDVEAHLTGRL